MTVGELNQAVAAWVDRVNGQYLDLDGYPLPPHNPYQCHDVWLSYLYMLGGQPGDGHAPGDDGWTSEVWLQFPDHRPNLANIFTKHYGQAGIGYGDVLFWRLGDPNYPYSHVAVALGPVVNGYVLCMTQNPGATHIENLPISEVLGYLQPITDSTPAPPIKKKVIVIPVSYSPKPEQRQSFKPGGYNIVSTSDEKPGKSRSATIASGEGTHLVYGQLNVTGPVGVNVELAMSIDTVDAKTGKRIGEPRFVGAESGTIGSEPLKIGVTVPLALKANKDGRAERVRLYVKPTKHTVKATFVRGADAQL